MKPLEYDDSGDYYDYLKENKKSSNNPFVDCSQENLTGKDILLEGVGKLVEVMLLIDG